MNSVTKIRGQSVTPMWALRNTIRDAGYSARHPNSFLPVPVKWAFGRHIGCPAAIYRDFTQSTRLLRHCDKSRKVAVSIPTGVLDTFHWHNPSGRTVILRSTQPLTEMSTMDLPWGAKAAGAYGWQHGHFMCRLSANHGSLNLLEPWGLCWPVQRWFLPSLGNCRYTVFYQATLNSFISV